MEELLFQDLKNWLYEDKRNSEWTTIYQDVAKTTTRRIVYAIMLPENLTEKFLMMIYLEHQRLHAGQRKLISLN